MESKEDTNKGTVLQHPTLLNQNIESLLSSELKPVPRTKSVCTIGYTCEDLALQHRQ